MTDAGEDERFDISRILIDRAPGQTRALLLDSTGSVLEIWGDFAHRPDLTASVYRVRINHVIPAQNRAFAALADGTSISVRTSRQSPVRTGQEVAVTLTAAPREEKPWQAVVGAKLAGARMVLLPGESGVSQSRAMATPPDPDSLSGLQGMLADAGQFGLILRRNAGAAGREVLLAECAALLADWQAGLAGPEAHNAGAGSQAVAPGLVFDAGGLAAQARRLAPHAAIEETSTADAAADFASLFAMAMDEATQPSIAIGKAGMMWVERTRALTAIDFDSGGGDINSLFADAPAALARAIRLRAVAGLVAIDLPRASQPVMRDVTARLTELLAADPRSPEMLGMTRGGVLECRVPFGRVAPEALYGDAAAAPCLDALRDIFWRPHLAMPAIELPPAMAEWLRQDGAAALQALDRPVRLVVSSDIDLPQLMEPGI